MFIEVCKNYKTCLIFYKCFVGKPLKVSGKREDQEHYCSELNIPDNIMKGYCYLTSFQYLMFIKQKGINKPLEDLPDDT
jgi:hypothetical protein